MAARIVWYQQGQTVNTRDFKMAPLVFKSFTDLHLHLSGKIKVRGDKKKPDATMVSVTTWIDGARPTKDGVAVYRGGKKVVFNDRAAKKYVHVNKNKSITITGRFAINHASSLWR